MTGVTQIDLENRVLSVIEIYRQLINGPSFRIANGVRELSDEKPVIVSEVFNECIGLFSTVESLAFNHIPRLAEFTGLIVQM
jgi:hypothetical protein